MPRSSIVAALMRHVAVESNEDEEEEEEAEQQDESQAVRQKAMK